MKRDMDFVRDISLKIEEGRRSFNIDHLRADNDEKMNEIRKLTHHLIIMHEADIISIVGKIQTRDDIAYELIEVSGLTWKGHDFIDTIRDPVVWRKTKEGASKAGGAGFGFIIELGKAYAKSELQKLGLPLG